MVPGTVLVFGHSTGGASARQLTIRHPDAVAGLILADTGATGPGRPSRAAN
jgi:pimeloyl-ACP methyl ester carboxylesterase